MDGDVRFGLFIPNFMAQGIDVPELTRLAELADRATRFDDIWVGDHIVLADRIRSRHPNFGRAVPSGALEDFTQVGLGGMPASDPVFEPLTLLSYLAGLTSRVRLGIGIMVTPLRHPVLAAKMLAAIDVLSNGRLIVGTGTGWLREEYDAVGATWAGRGPRTDDYIKCMRYLWGPSTDEGFHSPSVRVSPGVQMYPKPPQGRELPVWIGGNSEPALQRAARLGSGWHGAQLSPDAAKKAVTRLRELLEENGRPSDALTLSLRLTSWVQARARRDSTNPLVGSEQQILEVLFEYQQAGLHHIQLAPPPMVDLKDLSGQTERLDRITAEFRASDGITS
ncbi:TIGR03619 family F420-dependent LLM class oxidoreductase [Streptosporangium sp. NBC_01755]|uniref:TIGR03619 family F420-dependent LLM class oxidoreductase n=1 Tax=Streptosporangium sp. NBC_01755 TaxID=2975949 RepID=UPI002DDAB1BE|nr:TIGR03619 family F420-dependent LLM class oxidoreductase [Streptosporangium sp. NBC_01755]WSD00315.1 TIGR03619 family F420-dependent LLM class oxidoreductase [Streptosporangium sp. NBC_01755]